MPTIKNIIKSEYIPLYALLLIATASRFPFVLKGFGETDAANLAVSIIDYINHGKKGFLTNLYFLDVVPLYVTYIKFLMKLLNGKYQYLPLVMNYTSAVFGALIIIPAYLFTKKLFDNKTIAFCTSITFIFAPSIYQASIYGFPSLVALFFFLSSLYFFLLWLDDSKYPWLILSIITLTATILCKNDFILSGGAYLGLLYMRRVREKSKIVSAFVVVILSFVSLMLLRRWMTGIDQGYTTSYSNFLDWFYRFLEPLFSKSLSLVLENQVAPIAYGIGLLSFFMAIIAFIFYLIKRKSHIIVLVLSWTAVPTLLWLLLWNNNARHNIQSVLPFIVIIFLFLHEKAPRFMVFFPLILILGNYLITPQSPSTRLPSGNLFESQALLDNKIENIHMVARKIAASENNKLIFMTQSFRPYLLFEIISSATEYKLMDIGDSCYGIESNSREYMICSNINFDPDPIIYIKDLIAKYQLEEYTVVIPMLNLTGLEEEGFRTIDIDDVKSWAVNEEAIIHITGSQG